MFPPDMWKQSTLLTGFNNLVDAKNQKKKMHVVNMIKENV